MTERPILFSGPMVLAILEGQKTQTRRVCKPQPHSVGDHFATRQHGHLRICKPDQDKWHEIPCPYGQPGDRLWVRETHWIWGRWFKIRTDETGLQKWTFKADTPHTAHFDPDHVQNAVKGKTPRERRAYWKRPSIFMPRWACRLVLEVKSVRVERLQEISRGDCMSEGCPFPNMQDGPSPKTWFSDLWNSINAKRAPWDSNPWVWVVEFERVESGAGTDQ